MTEILSYVFVSLIVIFNVKLYCLVGKIEDKVAAL